MIENPTNFADQFKNLLEYQANLMKGFFSKSGGDIAGDVNITGNLTATGAVSGQTIDITSDSRLKENIKKIESKVGFSNINVYTYNLVSTPDEDRIGLIAQEVEKVFPEAVKEHNGYLKLDYNAIVSLLVLKNKELEQRIKTLEDKLYGDKVS